MKKTTQNEKSNFEMAKEKLDDLLQERSKEERQIILSLLLEITK